jgi:hypothetical protein
MARIGNPMRILRFASIATARPADLDGGYCPHFGVSF